MGCLSLALELIRMVISMQATGRLAGCFCHLGTRDSQSQSSLKKIVQLVKLCWTSWMTQRTSSRSCSTKFQEIFTSLLVLCGYINLCHSRYYYGQTLYWTESASALCVYTVAPSPPPQPFGYYPVSVSGHCPWWQCRQASMEAQLG